MTGQLRDRRPQWAEEDAENQPERVERRESRAEHSGKPERRMSAFRRPCLPDDQVFAEETGRDERQPRERAASSQECPESDGQRVSQSAHAEDAVLVVYGLDDDAGAQEQERLEERVGEEVEQGGLPRAYSKREEHVTDLADRGI